MVRGVTDLGMETCVTLGMLTAAQADEVKKYRADGETAHKAGKHDESLKLLGEAEKLLGI